MGVYYAAVCDAKRERIDPGYINNMGIKRGAIAFPNHPLGPIVIFALVSGRWPSARLAHDAGGDDEAYENYTDVTAEVVAEYVAEYGDRARMCNLGDEAIQYTGRSPVAP